MTFFIKVENNSPIGFTVTEENLKQLFPNHSFPTIYTPENIAPFGFAIYEWSQVPETSYPYKPVEVTPTLRNGIYYQTWEIQEMSDSEKAFATEEQAKRARAERNHKLLVTDWTQISDAPISAELRQLYIE